MAKRPFTRMKIGERVGSRVVIARVGMQGATPLYLTRCDCGAERVLRSHSVRAAARCRQCYGPAKRKNAAYVRHEQPIYQNWVSMLRRCRAIKGWHDKGITVCTAWQDFETFSAWALANGYRKGLSIDRINNDGNYDPANCEWVTRSENSRRCRRDYFAKQAAL